MTWPFRTPLQDPGPEPGWYVANSGGMDGPFPTRQDASRNARGRSTVFWHAGEPEFDEDDELTEEVPR